MPDQTKRMRRQFCSLYAMLGNISEAARGAGVPPDSAFREGLEILGMPQYQRLIQRLTRMPRIDPRHQVRAGLERLAFGTANDALALLLSEEPMTGAQLSRLDLFNVSEIKKVKGGGLEIKFFDRQRALERMYEYASSADSGETARSLLAALAGGGEDAEDGV